jgi:hypothetical protein
MTALPTFATEANALQVDVNAQQVSAAAQVTLATTQANLSAAQATQSAASAAASAASSTASIWVSGTTYAIGNVRFSPVSFQSYRRKTAGAGTTDPSTDSTNWVILASIPIVPTWFVMTSSATWTCPPNVTKAKVTVTGGGGSAGNSTASQASGGGGGGGTAIKYLTVIPGTVYTATIGAGGVAIASGAASATGNNGGTSTFAGAGITTISASGGLGGPASGRGGLGGATFSGDDISIIGGVGLSAVGNGSTPPPHGGSSYWAGLSPDGVAGVGFGNGGGGKWSNTGGPAGAAGIVTLEY